MIDVEQNQADFNVLEALQPIPVVCQCHFQRPRARVAYAELIRLTGSKAAARRLIARIRLKRAWEACQRCGKSVVNAVSSLILILVFVVVGPFCFSLCRSRLDQVTVTEDWRHAIHERLCQMGSGSALRTFSVTNKCGVRGTQTSPPRNENSLNLAAISVAVTTSSHDPSPIL